MIVYGYLVACKEHQALKADYGYSHQVILLFSPVVQAIFNYILNPRHLARSHMEMDLETLLLRYKLRKVSIIARVRSFKYTLSISNPSSSSHYRSISV